MQVSYNYNMVAIVNHRPVTLGVIEILDAYIAHQKEVILRRTKFDLDRAKAEMHIVEGLIKALSILDEVIKTIRGSKNKADAKENLVKLYDFTEKQAEAIVMLQLYKLTNTDVTELMERKDSLVALIKELDEILNDENKLKSVMKDELRSVKKEYATPRKTEILDEVEDIKIDTTKMIPKEDCIVVVTNEGYVKRVSLRSYSASDDETLVKEGDYVIGLYELNTLDTVLLFTNLGNYLYVPVHEIPDLKWKELGKHISNIIKIDSGEVIVSSIPVTNFDINKYITTFSKDGLVKRTKLSEFKASRYSKPMGCMKLKGNDIVIEATINDGNEVFITTERGYALRYNVDEISIIGLKGSGVKSIALKDDEVVSANIFNSTDYVTVITKNGTGKRIKLSEFEVSTRARRGILLVRDVKTNPYSILKTFITDNKNLSIVIKNDITKMKSTELPIVDRLSTGTVISKKGIDDCFMNCNLVKREENNNTVEKEEIVIDMEEEIIDIPLDIIDEQILTIDDFLDDFEI